jgi:hypothetical protein
MKNNYFEKYNNKTLIDILLKLNTKVENNWYKEICNSMERDFLINSLKKELNEPFKNLKDNILENLTHEDIFTNNYLDTGLINIIENDFEILFETKDEEAKRYILEHLILHLELLTFCDNNNLLQFIKIYNLNENQISLTVSF